VFDNKMGTTTNRFNWKSFFLKKNLRRIVKSGFSRVGGFVVSALLYQASTYIKYGVCILGFHWVFIGILAYKRENVFTKGEERKDGSRLKKRDESRSM